METQIVAKCKNFTTQQVFQIFVLSIQILEE